MQNNFWVSHSLFFNLHFCRNYSLLSFGEEAEEEEEEIDSLNKQLSEKGIKGKSSHDLTADPKLSSKPAIDQMDVGTTEENTNKRKIDKDDNAESKNDDDDNDDDDDDMSLDPGHSSIRLVNFAMIY